MVLLVVLPVPRPATAASLPKLRVRLGAFVIISVAAEVPMLPLRVVRVKLPAALVVIVFDEDEVMLPEPVDKLTAVMALVPRLPVMAIGLELV